MCAKDPNASNKYMHTRAVNLTPKDADELDTKTEWRNFCLRRSRHLSYVITYTWQIKTKSNERAPINKMQQRLRSSEDFERCDMCNKTKTTFLAYTAWSSNLHDLQWFTSKRIARMQLKQWQGIVCKIQIHVVILYNNRLKFWWKSCSNVDKTQRNQRIETYGRAECRGGLDRLAIWHLPAGPVGPPAR